MDFGKLVSLPIFLVLFGVLFLVVGVQRLGLVAIEQKKGEAMLWGSVGVVLAVLFLGAAVWLITGDSRGIDRQLLELRTRVPRSE